MVKFTVLEDEYIIKNYAEMSCSKLAKTLGRDFKQTENHIRGLKNKNLLCGKSSYVPAIDGTKLEIQGIQNKNTMTSIRKRIKLNKFIKLQINNVVENCEIIFKTYNYFTIRHKNYVESFNYTDVLMGVVTFG